MNQVERRIHVLHRPNQRWRVKQITPGELNTSGYPSQQVIRFPRQTAHPVSLLDEPWQQAASNITRGPCQENELGHPVLKFAALFSALMNGTLLQEIAQRWRDLIRAATASSDRECRYP